VGNGLALIFLVKIVVAIPRSIALLLGLGRTGALSIGLIGVLAVLTIALVAFIVMTELARRHIPIEYERSQIGDPIIEKQSSTLPLKLNGAGMIPVVVAPWPLSILFAFSADGPEWLLRIAEQCRMLILILLQDLTFCNSAGKVGRVGLVHLFTPAPCRRRGSGPSATASSTSLAVEAKALADLKIEKAVVEGQRRTVETDLGPARYLTTLIGADNETVLSWCRR
jgi:hypothetical protein